MGEKLNQQTIALPQALLKAVAKAQEAWRSKENTRRLWSKDATLWTGQDECDWLGWLDIIDSELHDVASVQDFGGELRAENFTDVLLLGMGGSSLGPEVLAKSLGSAPGYPKLHVLDSTDPEQIRRFERGIDIARTLFIVSSKSGTTLEPNVLMEYFFASATAALGGPAGRHFVAITDPGSRLQKTAEKNGFRRVFLGVPSIGGRYSVLSKFGLVPLAATGHGVRAFLEAAAIMARACGPKIQPTENPGVALGLAVGVLAAHGRDKLTVIASPSIAPFGAWVEQLVAESTGKNGHGVIPIADEPLGDATRYDAHRLFVYLRDNGHPNPAQDQAVEALERAGHPVVRIGLASPAHLAQEFFRFEMATAVAGAVIGINPFDQPDVEASKVATREMTDAFDKTGSLPSEPPVFEANGIALYTDALNAEALRNSGRQSRLKAGSRHIFPGSGTATISHSSLISTPPSAAAGAAKSARERARSKARRDLSAIRSAFPALDRTGLQRRPELRRISSDHGAAGARLGDTGTYGKLRRDRGGTSTGRLSCPGRAQPARIARAHGPRRG